MENQWRKHDVSKRRARGANIGPGYFSNVHNYVWKLLIHQFHQSLLQSAKKEIWKQLLHQAMTATRCISTKRYDHLDKLNVASHQPLKPIPSVNPPILHFLWDFLKSKFHQLIFFYATKTQLVDPGPQPRLVDAKESSALKRDAFKPSVLDSVGSWSNRRIPTKTCGFFGFSLGTSHKLNIPVPLKTNEIKGFEICWDLWSTNGIVI